ncbi:MAG: hypothetical protein B7Z20_09435 [Sphingobium sp. 32-64-5]|nr:MAG: hypothetical protein B7Z20_09435 [Sphingobium sp. 32-64-5]
MRGSLSNMGLSRKRRPWRCWRTGAAENDHLSVFYADVDNANPDQPAVTMEMVASKLDALFGPLP